MHHEIRTETGDFDMMRNFIAGKKFEKRKEKKSSCDFEIAQYSAAKISLFKPPGLFFLFYSAHHNLHFRIDGR